MSCSIEFQVVGTSSFPTDPIVFKTLSQALTHMIYCEHKEGKLKVVPRDCGGGGVITYRFESLENLVSDMMRLSRNEKYDILVRQEDYDIAGEPCATEQYLEQRLSFHELLQQILCHGGEFEDFWYAHSVLRNCGEYVMDIGDNAFWVTRPSAFFGQ